MRAKLNVVIVVALFLFGGAGILLSQGAPDADGLPDISGTWVAKAKVKGYDMTGDDEGDRETVIVAVLILQKGPGIEVTITPPGEDPIVLEGLVGDGHLWAGTGSETKAVVMVGHVKKKGKIIKGMLLSGEDDGLAEVKILMKRPK